jgi:hypothetical protein
MQAVPNTPDSYIHKGYLQQQGADTAALMQSLLQTALTPLSLLIS